MRLKRHAVHGGMKQEHWHRIALSVLYNNKLGGDIFQDAD